MLLIGCHVCKPIATAITPLSVRYVDTAHTCEAHNTVI